MKSDQQPPVRDNLRGLFHPGNGVMPPHLAGRDKEQSVMEEFLFALQNNRPADKDIILYGPRGNGKTVFLTRFEGKAAETLQESSVLSLRPGDIDTVEKGGLLLNDSLVERCREKPLVVTIDEAHTLDSDVGRYLLNRSEQVRRRGAPFLLVLAGTPDLEDRIVRMGASFWSRARIMGFGRLTRKATTDAIVIPLSANGVDFEPDALQVVLDGTQLYPYFIQLWGESLCNALRRNGDSRVIDLKLVESGFEDYDHQCTVYYRTRHSEFVDGSLLDAAVDVALAFSDRTALGEQALADVVDAETKQRLRSLGYIWQDPLSTQYEPGIPGLMDYVLTERRGLTGERTQGRPTEPDEAALPENSL